MGEIVYISTRLSRRHRITSASMVDRTLDRARHLRDQRINDFHKGDKVTLHGKTGAFVGASKNQPDYSFVFIEGALHGIPHDKVDPARPEHFA